MVVGSRRLGLARVLEPQADSWAQGVGSPHRRAGPCNHVVTLGTCLFPATVLTKAASEHSVGQKPSLGLRDQVPDFGSRAW